MIYDKLKTGKPQHEVAMEILETVIKDPNYTQAEIKKDGTTIKISVRFASPIKKLLNSCSQS